MKTSIKNRIFIHMIIYTFVISLMFLTSCSLFIVRDTAKDAEDTAKIVENFVSTIVDADMAKIYITKRNPDDEYENTNDLLIKYTQKSEMIKSISIISYSESVGYYIYDTNGNKLGTKVQYDEYTSTVKSKLLEGTENWSVITEGIHKNYFPLISSEDKLVGYMVIDITYHSKVLYILIFAGSVILMFIIGIIAAHVVLELLKWEIFKPMEKLEKTALDFTSSVSNKSNENIMEIFELNRDDEIGHLANALKKMVSDINNATEDLSNALFEATHDGMTQVFNKRYYNEKYPSFEHLESIAVMYFDVNNLKLMNDTLGHERGDYVIKQAADYIRKFIDEDSYCFRMGGDEFLLIMANVKEIKIGNIVDAIESDSPRILSEEKDSIKCSLAFGCAYANGEYSYDALLAEAENQMYVNKSDIKKKLNMPDR